MIGRGLAFISVMAGLLMASLSLGSQTGPQNWLAAKKQARMVHRDFPYSFYCHCKIEFDQRFTPFDKSTCGYQARNPENANGRINKRTTRIEWEHVFSAWEFGHKRECWQKGGRKNCKRTDLVYQQMEYDLHNLVPAIGELNADRSNRKFGIIADEKRMYGQCDFEVSFEDDLVEPRASVRGNIARIYFYMAQRYQLALEGYPADLFTSWDQLDPVDAQECLRDQRIQKVQGNSNPFVASHCPSSDGSTLFAQ